MVFPFKWRAVAKSPNSVTSLWGKWKSRIWENPDANTETEKDPEVVRSTGSATGSDTRSVLFYFLFILLLYIFYFLFSFTSYCVIIALLELNSGLLL